MRIPVLSVSTAALTAAGALVSLVLGFLILGEDLARFVPRPLDVVDVARVPLAVEQALEV